MKIFGKRKNRVLSLYALMTVLFVVASAGLLPVSDAAAAVYLKNSYARFSATAGETLAVGNIVCLKDSDGKAYKADANDATLRPAVGVVTKGGATNSVVSITTIGIMGGYTSLSEGAEVYLSETAGGYTQVAPTYSQMSGFAISATTIYWNFRNFFDTSGLTALGVLTGATPLILEGATADDYETTVSVTDPTADRTLTIPNKSVTLASSVLVVTADANGKTVAASETGDMQSCGGAGVWNIPEASTCIGCMWDFAVTAAANVDINPDDADQILGLTNAVGDAIRCAGVGGTIRLVVLDDTNIAAIGAYCPGGSWADVN